MKLNIYQVDAFTSKPFGGNPAAIVPLDAWLPDGLMQLIALENNLSETAFFVKNGDVYDIRWFTPTFEIDLCGHATLASAHVIFDVLGLEQTNIKFLSHKSGELGVEKNGDVLTLDFPSRPPVPCDAPDGLFEAIGKRPKEVLKSRDYFLVYENEQEILDIRPNFSLLAEIPTHAVIVTAHGETCDFVSRFFAPEAGINEDPVTGSAHCNLIPYWAEKLGKTEMFARQVSARGGELFCELGGDRVKIGGNGVLYLKGEIYVEATGGKSIAA
ncbi:MAG: PhzF family phenazine biosynthesis protein [Pyrinomonadaceae bacterium]